MGAVSPPQRRWASTARGCRSRTSQRRPAGVSMGCGPSMPKGSELRPASSASMRATTGSTGAAFGFRGGVSGTAAFYRILPAGPTRRATQSATNSACPDLPAETVLSLPSWVSLRLGDQDLSGGAAHYGGSSDYLELYVDVYPSRNRFTANGCRLESPAPHCLHRGVIKRLIH